MIAHATLEATNAYVNHVVRWCEDIETRGFCTTTWQPGTYGDCKQVATLKLAMLLRQGAKPSDLTIWITKRVGDKANHAVLVYNPTAEVLDVPGAWVCGSYGCTRSNQIATIKIKQRHEGMKFLSACPACSYWARRLAKTGHIN